MASPGSLPVPETDIPWVVQQTMADDPVGARAWASATELIRLPVDVDEFRELALLITPVEVPVLFADVPDLSLVRRWPLPSLSALAVSRWPRTLWPVVIGHTHHALAEGWGAGRINDAAEFVFAVGRMDAMCGYGPGMSARLVRAGMTAESIHAAACLTARVPNLPSDDELRSAASAIARVRLSHATPSGR